MAFASAACCASYSSCAAWRRLLLLLSRLPRRLRVSDGLCLRRLLRLVLVLCRLALGVAQRQGRRHGRIHDVGRLLNPGDRARNAVQQPRDEGVLDLLDERVVEKACAFEVAEDIRHDVADVPVREPTGGDLAGDDALIGDAVTLLLDAPLLLLCAPRLG